MSESRQSIEFERRKVLCLRASVNMAVMRVWKVRVDMLHRVMVVTMCMLLAGCQGEPWMIGVFVLMVLIMHMFMFVIHGLVDMGVLVVLGQMQPYAKSHQQPGGNESGCDRFATGKRQCGSEERSN